MKIKWMKFASVCLLLSIATIASGWLAKWSYNEPIAHQNISGIDWQTISSLKDVVPVVIIGSGPAALSAAIYTARNACPSVVIEGKKPGGALTDTAYVENWPGKLKILGADLIGDVRTQAEQFGARFLSDTVVSIDLSTWPFHIRTAHNKLLRALSVIITTGATPRMLNIPGEQKYWAKGVTTCALCDAPFYKDKHVFVVGGGDSAIEEAMQLSSFAKSVTILVRSDRMRASAIMQEKLHEYPNVTVRYNTKIDEVFGDETKVTGALIANTKTGQQTQEAIDGIFLAIGQDPNTSLFAKQLNMNKQGFIQLHGRTQYTSVEGVFAAGDVVDDRYRQAGTASGDGIKAAIDASRWLQTHGFSPVLAHNFSKKLDQSMVFADNQNNNVSANDKISKKIAFLSSIEEFSNQVEQQNGLAVLDFYTDYCPSCKRMMPAFEEVAQEFSSQAAFYKVDANKAHDIAQKFHVKSLPVILIFQKGALVGRYNEAMNKQELTGFIERFLS